ncbi:MAG: site-2 protease family protein, partial [Bacilli bacterium]|nr:site-2 protease family protein [Bacilli bacterium]
MAAFSGNFRKMILFTSLILVHELGHYLTAYFFHWKVDKIVLYPYGGCSYFEVDVNCSSLQEFFVLIMGPIFQLIFTYFI